MKAKKRVTKLVLAVILVFTGRYRYKKKKCIVCSLSVDCRKKSYRLELLSNLHLSIHPGPGHDGPLLISRQ